MQKDLIHVYFIPGMAANTAIFENIILPKNKFEMHYLEWMIPEENETLEAYAKRMAAKIEYPNPVLVGVSFGGILVQEMSKCIEVKKLIVISSVKSKYELPKRMKILRITNAYKILPTQWVSNIELFAKYTFVKNVTKRLELYQKYLSIRDKTYLDWSIKQIIFWDQEFPNPKAVYIHGDNDAVFPHSCQGNCIIIKGGTHIMIINKYKWFNKHLPELILN